MNNSIDIIKFLACILIVASHTLPLFGFQIADFYYGQWFFRFCVPLFFISTGFFFSKMKQSRRWQYIKRIALLYVVSTFFYLPLFIRNSPIRIASHIILGYHHLWYLSALLFGLIGLQLLDRAIPKGKRVFMLSLVGGVLLDEYHKLFDFAFLNKVVGFVSYIGGARHAFFFALPMLLIGEWIGTRVWKRRNNTYIGLFLILLSFGFIEATLLKSQLGTKITLDVSLFGWMPAIPLFLFGLTNESRMKAEKSRSLRKVTDIVYIIHIWVLTIINRLFSVEYGLRFFIVIIVSFGVATAFILYKDRFTQKIADRKNE